MTSGFRLERLEDLVLLHSIGELRERLFALLQRIKHPQELVDEEVDVLGIT